MDLKKFAKERKYDYDLLIKFGWYQENDVIKIRYSEDYVVTRTDSQKCIKPKDKKGVPYFLKGSGDKCAICEGETDAVALKHMYPELNVFAIGGVNNYKIIEKLPVFYSGNKLILVYDNDDKGKKCADDTVYYLLNSPKFGKYNIRILSYDRNVKDIDEYYRRWGKNEQFMDLYVANFKNKKVLYDGDFLAYLKSLTNQNIEIGKKIKCINPDHNDSTPSLHIYEDHAFCFSCGFYLSPRKKKRKEDGDDNIVRTSFIEDYPKLVEQVKRGNISKFCVYDTVTDSFKFVDQYEREGLVYMPQVGEEIDKDVLKLPSEPVDYGTDDELESQISGFIHKWLDIPDDMMTFAVWNIKRAWVYDRFHTINYLRALGDTGQGKTRFLDTLGNLHYKPISTSGSTTSAPVFRSIEKWKGTLIMDEADFHKSDEAQDMIKIINTGYEKGKYVMRCDPNDANIIQFFDTYCPKILATRRTFTDKAVESRCITHVMCGTTRDDIPLNLNKVFWAECAEIRNKLLMWRFRNYFKIDDSVEVELELPYIEKRLKQIVSSFACLFVGDRHKLDKFKSIIMEKQEELIQERQNTFEGQIVGAIHALLMDDEKEYITATDIVERGNLVDFRGNSLSPRALTNKLRVLGLSIDKRPRKIDGVPKKVLLYTPTQIKNLYNRYGYPVTKVTIVTVKGGVKKKDECYTGVYNKKKNLGSLDNYGNLGNSVTEEEVLDEFDKIYKSLSNPKNHGIIAILDISQLLGDEKTDKYLKPKLEQGDYFQPKYGFIKKTE